MAPSQEYRVELQIYLRFQTAPPPSDFNLTPPE